MPRSGRKAAEVVAVGGVESKFSVQLSPKLNNICALYSTESFPYLKRL